MHGSLAHKLRVLGFDASYYRAGGDEGMVELSKREGRIIITSDRSLAAMASSARVPCMLVGGKSDGSRLREVAIAAASLGIDLKRGDPLCSLCGGELESLRRSEAAGLVPESVERRHRLFHRCTSCGQVYWRGSHWKKLSSLARRLGTN